MLPGSPAAERRRGSVARAEIALQLSHGAIRADLDVVRDRGRLCLLQEFIQGTDAAHSRTAPRARMRRLRFEIAVNIGAENSAALAYAQLVRRRRSGSRGPSNRTNVTCCRSAASPKLVRRRNARAASEQPLTEVPGRRAPAIPGAEVLAANRRATARYLLSVVVLGRSSLAGPSTEPEMEPLAPPSSANPPSPLR